MINISVVVPVYNAESHIRKCLGSLMAQKFDGNIEYIIVNDGSTDQSESICRELCKKDARFKFFTKQNGGSASARNFGIEHACGEYIAFLDSDDYVDDKHYQELYTCMIRNKADIVGFPYVLECENNSTLVDMGLDFGIFIGERKELVMAGIIAENCSGVRSIKSALWGKLFSISIIRKNYKKVNEQIREGEDLSLLIRCCSDAEKIYISEKASALYHYVSNSGQITRKYDPYYERRVPLLYNSLITANEEKGIANFEKQFERIVIFSTCKCFENLFYRKNTSYIEARQKIRYMCQMAKYYSKITVWPEDTLPEKCKKVLIKTGNAFMIYLVYHKRTKKVES